LAEVKARVLEHGLLTVRGKAQDFIKSSRALLYHYKGADARSTLMSTPAIAIAVDQHGQLASDIDDIRDPLVTKPEDLIFNKVRYLGFDASRLLTTRAHEILLASNATLINQLSMWTREYVRLTEEILSNPHLDDNTARAYARKLFRTKVIGSVMPGFPLSAAPKAPS